MTIRRPSRLIAPTVALALALAWPGLGFALTPGSPAGIPFPRIGAWGPDVRYQSLQDIARYDYEILDPYRPDVSATLRSLNPDIVLLAYVSSSQRPLHSEPGDDDSSNAQLMKIPNEWLLTQVGSRLTAGVTAGATTLPVADTSVFRVGDVVVIEHELAKVEGISGSSIQVRRGLIPSRSPAAAHPASTRVAAVLQVWPGLVELDLSTYSPRVTVDPAVGPETWGEYNARTSAALASTAAWDGLFIDAVSGQEARWLGRPLARTIDPTRSNRPVGDGYAGFEAAWRDGLRRSLSAFRSRLPASKVMVGNVAKANQDLLNGSNVEGFPKDNPPGLSASWPYWHYWQDWLEYYLDWTSSGRQPNFSTLMTYYDDSEPAGTEETSYSNPVGDPSWQPDYRKMRFGLTTALMGNGFYNYAINTHGWSSLGLLWFDEYDNAGAQRGYLGQPLGAARLALPRLMTPDLLNGDGAFSTQAQNSRWYSWTNPGYSLSRSIDRGISRVVVGSKAGDENGAVLAHDAIPVESGSFYTLRFRVRADRPVTIYPRVTQRVSPYSTYLYYNRVDVGTSWRRYEISLPSQGTDPSPRLVFAMGAKSGTIWIDDVKIQKGSRLSIYRRDYAGGAALVNPTDATATIDLGMTYHKIDGTQDPSVNDGSAVRTAVVPPRDGLVVVGPSVPTTQPTFHRFQGPDRYGTSIKTSQETFANGSSRYVVLATGANFADALASAALVGSYDSPILLTRPDSLPNGLLAEIDRLRGNAKGEVLIIGSEAAVKPAVQAALTAHGLNVRRIYGPDRFATAAAIAREVRRHEVEDLGHPFSGEAFVVNGLNYPDALSASPYAARKKIPILLVRPTSIPGPTARVLSDLAIRKVWVVGGPGTAAAPVVSEGVFNALPGSKTRIYGASRYDTGVSAASAAVANGWGSAASITLTTGRNFPDALSGGPVVAKAGGVMLLTDPLYLVEQDWEFIYAHRDEITSINALGAASAVDNEIAAEVNWAREGP